MDLFASFATPTSPNQPQPFFFCIILYHLPLLSFGMTMHLCFSALRYHCTCWVPAGCEVSEDGTLDPDLLAACMRPDQARRCKTHTHTQRRSAHTHTHTQRHTHVQVWLSCRVSDVQCFNTTLAWTLTNLDGAFGITPGTTQRLQKNWLSRLESICGMRAATAKWFQVVR